MEVGNGQQERWFTIFDGFWELVSLALVTTGCYAGWRATGHFMGMLVGGGMGRVLLTAPNPMPTQHELQMQILKAELESSNKQLEEIERELAKYRKDLEKFQPLHIPSDPNKQ